jgi:short-subunit dehydrogenase
VATVSGDDLLRGTVLLTGASGGLGHAIADALADRGASLVLTGRRSDALEPLAARTGGRALTVDLADRAAVERLAAEAGAVDVLVNNAALPASGRLDDYSVPEIDRALDVNLRAPVVLARLLAEGMRARGSGHIVFISSLAGKLATGGSALYSATKFGLRGLAMGLREDLRGDGIGVSAIFPGFIREAGMFAEAGVSLPPGVGTRTPAQVAAAVVSAIEHDRAEVDVAPLSLRLSTAFGGLAPGTANALGRRLGSARVAADMSAGQRAKR